MAYETRLLRREQVAEGTTAFWFERPAGYQYQAGQNATFSLVEPIESDAFGPSRCLFESNFPVDKACYGYVELWNAFKRLTSDCSADDKRELFHDTAAHAYRLPTLAG